MAQQALLGELAHQQFAVVVQPHHRGRKKIAEPVRNQFRLAVAPDGTGAVGGAQVDTQNGHANPPVLKLTPTSTNNTEITVTGMTCQASDVRLRSVRLGMMRKRASTASSAVAARKLSLSVRVWLTRVSKPNHWLTSGCSCNAMYRPVAIWIARAGMPIFSNRCSKVRI